MTEALHREVLDDVRARLVTQGPRESGRGPGGPGALGGREVARRAGRGRLAAAVAAREGPAGVLGAEGVLGVTAALAAQITGAGPLQELVDEPGVTDVLVNGAHEVWVDRGHGLVRLPPRTARLGSEDDLRALAVRLAAAAGRRLDDASPFVDAQLPDGVRLHAALPPLSPAGTLLSLRVPRRTAFTLDELVAARSVPPAWGPVLRALVTRRASFLVTGGTGSGKTTVLSTLLGLADPAERLLLVEDGGELVPDHPHVVRLVTRHGNVEGAGRVDLVDLVRQALRMRPDRIVVGEVRGAEVRELLAALNTGHEGGAGTVHANTAADVPARLEALGALAGLGREALAAQAVSAVQVVVHLRRRAGHREMAEIAVLERDERRALTVTTALGPRGRGPGFARLQALTGAV